MTQQEVKLEQQWEELFPKTKIIAIGSGKGGVGKSTVTANLAFTLAKLGYKIGVIDADIYGFSLPRIMGLTQEPEIIDKKYIQPLERSGVKMISMGSFVDEEQPLAWRGPVLAGILEQFFREVQWGKLDYLLLDMPPGTGDVALTLFQQLPKAYFVIVTTPQAAAYHVSVRLGYLANQVKKDTIGIIENMAYFICNNCNEKHYIFGDSKEAVKDVAAKLQIPVLGSIPLRTEIRSLSDQGIPVVLENDEVAEDYASIAQKMIEQIEKTEQIRASRPAEPEKTLCSISGG
ncbi:Mrp/NBP35 family ATP-binding protein [Desulfolucanica intricata]|uniref:Mrp/NBP35 family ATP-binding protein n=1 Tax=Desulfolucanica intricata TaxID=1285191 RepID=UPI00082C2159|nr:Mrp/NBP35 family ATP-binding protein [Desulfolucanica intricata]